MGRDLNPKGHERQGGQFSELSGSEWLKPKRKRRRRAADCEASCVSPVSSANKTVEISMVFFLFCDVGVNYFFRGVFLTFNAFSYRSLTGPFAISGKPESLAFSKISLKNSSGMIPSIKI